MTTLARHQFTVQDEYGNVVAGAHVEVRSEDSGALAQLYSDRAGASTIANPVDTDSEGFVYFHVTGGAYKIRVYTGSSAAPTSERIYRYVGIGLNSEADALIESQRVVTAAGDVTITATDDDVIIINKTVGAATTANLPPSANRERPVTIVDGKFDAATNNITIVPNGSETVMGGASYVIDSNGASIKLRPRADGTGWF